MTSIEEMSYDRETIHAKREDIIIVDLEKEMDHPHDENAIQAYNEKR